VFESAVQSHVTVAVILENLDVIDKSVHSQRFLEEQIRRQVNESR